MNDVWTTIVFYYIEYWLADKTIEFEWHNDRIVFRRVSTDGDHPNWTHRTVMNSDDDYDRIAGRLTEILNSDFSCYSQWVNRS